MIRSIADLQQMKEAYQEKMGQYSHLCMVCYGTGCMSSGCKNVRDALVEELEKAGYLNTVPAKGSYVAEKNTQLIRETYLTQIEEHLTQILPLADSCGLGEDDLIDLLHLLYQEHHQPKGEPL